MEFKGGTEDLRAVTYVMAIGPHVDAVSPFPFCTPATFFSPFKTTFLNFLAHKAEKNGYPPALMFISLLFKRTPDLRIIFISKFSGNVIQLV